MQLLLLRSAILWISPLNPCNSAESLVDEPLGNPVDSFWTKVGRHVMHILYRDMHRVMHSLLHKCRASEMEAKRVASVPHGYDLCDSECMNFLKY